MMESIFISEPSPSQGGWALASEQDFCYGAKASPHLSTGVSSPLSCFSPNYLDSPKWIDESDNFDWSNLATFSDVLLPEDENFCQDPFEGISDQKEITPNQPFICGKTLNKPSMTISVKNSKNSKDKLTIKVKKVKKESPKTQPQNPNEGNSSLYEFLPAPTVTLFPNGTLPMDIILDMDMDIADEMNPNNDNFLIDSSIQENMPLILPKEEEQGNYLNPNRIWADDPSLSPVQPHPVIDQNPQHSNDLSVNNYIDTLISDEDTASLTTELCDFTLKDLINMDDGVNLIDKFLDDNPNMSQVEILDISDSPVSILEQSDSECINENITSLTQDSDYASDIKVSPKSKANKRHLSRRPASPHYRKSLKKEQNKQAALRYRNKKRDEENKMLDTLREAEEENAKLKETFSNLKKELLFMKKMMREAFIVKGLVSEDAFRKVKRLQN